jgi:hypothetical protein
MISEFFNAIWSMSFFTKIYLLSFLSGILFTGLAIKYKKARGLFARLAGLAFIIFIQMTLLVLKAIKFGQNNR